MIKESRIENTNLPDGWSIKVLSDFTETINGLWTGKKEPYIPVKVYTMSNFTKGCDLNHSKKAREVIASVSQYEKRKLKYGDIIIEKSGGGPNQPVGRAVLFNIKNNEENTFSNFTTRLRICEKNKIDVNSNYLHKFLKLQYLTGVTEKFQKNSTNIRNLQLKEYLQLEIPLPPLPQQKQIVAILDKAFAAIDTAKTNAEQNLQNAKELFESYLQNVFENKGADWVENTLGKVTSKIGSGATPRGGKANYKEEGISLIRSMNVHDFYFKKKNLAFIDDSQADALSNVTLKEKDVLLNITGASIARCCMIPKEYLPARVNQHVSIIRAKKEIINPIFLASLLTSKFFKDQILEIGEQGATRQAITKVQLESFVISFPKDIKEQKVIIENINTFKGETKKLETIYTQKIADLEEMKKSVLQKAFSGQLSFLN